MQINSLTPTSLASTVWTNAARTLTAFPLAVLASEVGIGVTANCGAGASAFGAYGQIVASLAHNCVGIWVSGIPNASIHMGFGIATGAALSEVDKITVELDVQSGVLAQIYIPLDPSIFVKGTRLSYRSRSDSGAGAGLGITCDFTIFEDAA